MYTLTDNSAFIWQDFGEGAEILRVYADNPHLCIPEKINGKMYCLLAHIVFLKSGG